MGRKSDGEKAFLANWIFSGALFLLSVFFLILNNYVSNLEGYFTFFLGLSFSMAFYIRYIAKEESIGNKFIQLLLLIMGIIGAALLAFTLLLAFFGEKEQALQALYVGILFAVPLQFVLIYWDEEFYTSARNWPTEFFKYCGHMVTFPVMCLITGIVGIFVNPFVLCLILINLLFAVGFGMSLRSGGVRGAFITLGVTLVLNIAVLFLGVKIDTEKLYTDGLHKFYVACCTFPFLAMVACAMVALLDRLTNLISDGLAFGVYAAIPAICFGLQFLVFYKWKIGLIVFGIALALIALFIILFKFVAALFWAIVEFFVGLFTGKLFKSNGGSSKTHKGGKELTQFVLADRAKNAVMKYHAQFVKVENSGYKSFTVYVKNANGRERTYILEEIKKAVSDYSYNSITLA